MAKIFLYLKRLDWTLIVVSLLLSGVGLLSIYSYTAGRGDFFNFKKQIIFLAAGIILMLVIGYSDWRVLRDNSYLILFLYFLSIAALLGLFFFAPKIRGTRGWYRFGSFSLDPVEFAKIILLVLLAKYFSMRHIEMYRLRHILLSGFYVLLPAVLVFRQPNLGSSLIFIALWLGILVVSGIKLRHFLILILLGAAVLILSWFFLMADYQKERVSSFLAPSIDPKGSSWSQTQSKIAIGSGGIFGQGFQKGSQTQYGFLTEPHNDFIFAAIAEEFGFAFSLFVFLCFVILIYRIMKIAFLSSSNFPRLFATGFAIVIFSEAFIHIAMNLGIMPVIGISLPLVSYGGSNLIATFIGLGILQSIKASP